MGATLAGYGAAGFVVFYFSGATGVWAGRAGGSGGTGRDGRTDGSDGSGGSGSKTDVSKITIAQPCVFVFLCVSIYHACGWGGSFD